jgi:hypothetical protein
MSGMHGVARMMRWTAGSLGLLAVGYATVAGNDLVPLWSGQVGQP